MTCLSFSHEDKTTFVVGSEGGGVFKCSTNATTTATSGMRDIIHWSFISSPSMSHSISTLFQSPWVSKISTPKLFWSLHSINSLISSPSSPFITCSFHPNLPLQCLQSHIFLWAIHDVYDSPFFISFYYVFIPSQPSSAMSTIPHLPLSDTWCLWLALLHLLLLRVHSIQTFLCNVYNPTSSSERYMMSMTRPSSSPFITCSFHPNLPLQCLQSHIFLWAIHDVYDSPFFISSYYVFIPSKPFLTSSAMSTIPHPWYLWPALLHVLLRVHTISTLQQPHIVLWSLHSMMSMTCDIRYARYNRPILHLFSYLGYLKFLHPKFFYLFIPFSLINSSYYVFIPSQPFLTSSAMSTIPHVPLSDPWCLRPVLLHLLLLRVHFIPTFPHFLCNVYNPTCSSEWSMMSTTRPSSSPLITCSFHPNLSSLPLQCLQSHMFLWVIHDVYDPSFFISYYLFIPLCFLPCDVYNPTSSSNFFIPWCLYRPFFLLQYVFIVLCSVYRPKRSDLFTPSYISLASWHLFPISVYAISIFL